MTWFYIAPKLNFSIANYNIESKRNQETAIYL